MTKVSVVVPTKNCASTISMLLDSLKKQDHLDHEVIVVDSSIDGTDKIASKYDAKVIRCTEQGLNIARNVGIQNSLGEIVCFIDGDCKARYDWLTKIVSEFDKSSRIGCVGGCVVVDPSTFLGGYSAEALVSMYPKYTKPGMIKSSHLLDQPFNRLRFPVGCNMAFRREGLVELGGFDEKWEYAWDEFEIMFRLLQQRHLISINPEIVVYHTPRSSIMEVLLRTYWYGAGAGYFMRRFNIPALKKRLKQTFFGVVRTVPHSIDVFRKTKRSSALLYPFMDFLIGTFYYIGFAKTYSRKSIN